jgi:Fe-S cluster assembly protein SufD
MAMLPESLGAPLPGFERLVTVNGRLAPAYGTPGALAMLAIDEPDVTEMGSVTASDADMRFALLARVFGAPALRLRITGRVQLEWLAFNSPAAGAAYPRLRLQLAAGAELTLAERQCGSVAPDALICSDFQCTLGAAAKLHHTRLHSVINHSLMLDNLSARLEARASYRLDQVCGGAAHARSTQIFELCGADSRLQWNGVATVAAGQQLDALVRVNHNAARTQTAHRFRGIAAGAAHLGCDADVRVSGSAPGAKVAQSLRALNDGAGALVSLRPRLTIETDDIQASHGATTGQLDENLLFYLLSRGIDRTTAKRLLKWAFLGDVLGGITPVALRLEAEQLAAGGLEELLALGLTP